MRGGRVGGLLLALLLGGAWQPAPARAHAQPVDATPGPGVMLATSPPRVQVVFDEELSDEGSRLQVFGPRGERADRRDLQVEGQRMWTSLQDQGPGLYRVRWRAIADEDKGETRGEYTFTVSPQLPPNVPQLTVAPPRANNGDSVALAGSGFSPSESVVLSVGDDEGLLTIVRADGQGRFSTRVALPWELPYGRQVIQAADAADHLAAAAVFVPRGGLPVATVRLGGEAQPDGIEYVARVANLSGYFLRGVVVRATIPAGTQVLAEGLGQPDGVEPPEIVGGQVVWRVSSLAPHSILGPFTFSALTTSLRGRPELAATATVEYRHTTPPAFRDQAQSEEVVTRPSR